MKKQNLIEGKTRARHVNGGHIERVTGRASSSRFTHGFTHPLASTACRRVFSRLILDVPLQVSSTCTPLSIEGPAVVVLAIPFVERRARHVQWTGGSLEYQRTRGTAKLWHVACVVQNGGSGGSQFNLTATT